MSMVDGATLDNETTTKPVCKFYLTIYKRMVRWFGYTYPFWLCDMEQKELLTSILRLVVTKNMYTIFINVSIRIRKNNNRAIDILEKYKIDNPDHNKRVKRQQYYDEHVEHIKEYNRMYHLIKTSRINIFKKLLR
jgi:hypothetical protein